MGKSGEMKKSLAITPRSKKVLHLHSGAAARVLEPGTAGEKRLKGQYATMSHVLYMLVESDAGATRVS